MSGKANICIDPDEFSNELDKVKACACALVPIGEYDIGGEVIYSPELMKMLSLQLIQAAQYLDCVLSKASE